MIQSFLRIIFVHTADRARFDILPNQEYFDQYQKIMYNASSNSIFVYQFLHKLLMIMTGFMIFTVKCMMKSVFLYQSSTRFGNGGTTSNIIGASVLTFLGYSYVTDIDIAKNQIF